MQNKKFSKNFLLAYSCFVLAPLLIVLMYLCVFAQDRYASSSTLLVKQVGEATVTDSSGLGALLGASNTSNEDANILKTYISSRDMVEKLDREINLRKAFQVKRDPLFALDDDAPIEDVVKYYNRVVGVNLDEKTMMLEVNAQGFSPEYSLKLSHAILKNSEDFINDISRSIAQEQQNFAEQQLKESTDQLKQARDDLLEYQNENEIFDPALQAQAVATLVASLQNNLAQLRTEERTLLSYLNPVAPQVIAVQSQIESLEQQIKNENAKLTSPSNTKLNQNVSEFEELKAQVGFATDLYKLSLASLEKSRLEASRKLKKLVVISTPRLAEDALYPRKLYLIITSFIVLNILFGIGALIRSIIREHKE
ncbi:capsule biosynthesis protein [Acinetobacter sp. 187]|uniref:capsule biosynthesis protein n=1 Tax=Acinetobacter lanii TaxID=2715163 RepID=UPI0014082A84|nr:capsule biosynthesis protein [Acinetobacter lanii]NHC03363.1 capsule biosynthesis protein [Acinetobacter lanii]